MPTKVSPKKTVSRSKKATKIPKRKKHFKSRGVIGDGILWGIILIGLVVMGFYFAGSALPQQRTSGEDQAVVTLLPQKEQPRQNNIQMGYFDGITGIPTPTPKKGGGGCNGGGGAPVGNTELFVGDYETGDFSQWENMQNRSHNGSGASWGGGYSAQIVSGAEACQGEHAARYEVRPGDKVAGGERSEVAQYGVGEVKEGDERWYEFSVKYDEGQPFPCGNYFIIMQWHSSEGSPPLAIEINCEGNIEIRNNRDNSQVYDAGPIVPGEWTDIVFHTKFSNNRSVGFVEMYVNGEQTVPQTPFRNMSDSGNYLKYGIYRGSSTGGTSVVYNDGLRITGP